MGNDAAKGGGTNQRTVLGSGTSGAVARPYSFSPYRSMDAANKQYPLDMFNNSKRANESAFMDYGDMMGDYKNLFTQAQNRPSTQFNFDPVSYQRPGEMNEAYGNLRSAGAGYQNFADTGGYSPTDIQELRARGTSPIRAAYGNTIRELSRANTLGGGASNYVAARSRAQRELPGQLAEGMTGVNAGLADAIRQGKLSGLSGLAGVGGTMGSMAGNEAGMMLDAARTNSAGNLQAQGMNESSRQFDLGHLLNIMQQRGSLYGTTPGMADMFGKQASNYMDTKAKTKGESWWMKALKVAGTVAPYVAMAASDKNLKENITEIDPKVAVNGLRKIKIHNWNYKNDDIPHMGPMAQDFKKHFGVGDGKTIHLVDVMGVMLAEAKARA